MKEWGFLTNHARALACIASDPGVRLREIAASLGVTERCAFGIVSDLNNVGYVDKQKDGRRNRYRVHSEAPLTGVTTRQQTIGELLALVVDEATHSQDDDKPAHGE